MVKKGETPRYSRFYSRSDGSMPSQRSPNSDNASVSLPSVRSTTRMSIRSQNRSNMASRLLLPSEFETPGPDAYNIRTTIGQTPGPSFKGNRERTFETAKTSNAVFLLPKLTNRTPAPGTYSLESGMGKGLKSTFGNARRDARFAGDRSNNAIFLLQKYDDPSPAPTRYNIKSSLSTYSGYLSDPTSARGSTFTRSKRDARFAGDHKAPFLLPRIIPQHPTATAYKTESVNATGKNVKGSTFSRARRNARFPGDNRALFLLTERADKFRRPHSYSTYGMN